MILFMIVILSGAVGFGFGWLVSRVRYNTLVSEGSLPTPAEWKAMLAAQQMLGKMQAQESPTPGRTPIGFRAGVTE